jgi:putative tricarboxylic transport membrane protein
LVGAGAVGLFEGIRLFLQISDKKEPIGPGGYVIFVAGILMICGLIYGTKWFVAIAAARKRARTEKTSLKEHPSMPLGRAIIPVAVFVAYVAAIPFIGYLVTTLLFFGFSMWTFGERSWVRCILISIVLTAVFYIGFGVVAEVVLP